MSQFKHNQAIADKNLHRILAAQFGTDSVQQMSSFEHFQANSRKVVQYPMMSSHRNKSSLHSNSTLENIYDSKINEERPKVNKSLGKHQINNNLHLWTKAGAKIYKDG